MISSTLFSRLLKKPAQNRILRVLGTDLQFLRLFSAIFPQPQSR